MDRRKILIPVLLFALAAVLLALYFLPRPEASSPVQNPGTHPPQQTRPVLTQPVETDDPRLTELETSGQTEPENTEPERTDPDVTEPEETELEETEPLQTEPTVTAPEIFPAELENGMLIVRSLFQFSGMNPDADNEFGDNIAGVEILNNSDSHMTYAEVTAVLTDGTVLTFRAEDVPAGRSVMALSLEHAAVQDVRTCEEVYAYAEFDSSDPLKTDLVECTVDGIAITLRNMSGGELTDLKVICHGLLDSSYFGGTTYQYHVSTLPAGTSTVVYATDCVLGMTEVVRLEIGS